MSGEPRSYYDVLVPSHELDDVTNSLIGEGHVVVAIDEVGRGALAGPVVVGAVALREPRLPPDGIDDSKKLSPRRRQELAPLIIQWASQWALGESSAQEIDQWGLRFALAVAATRAIQALPQVPTFALIDGPLNLLDAPDQLDIAERPSLDFARLEQLRVVRGDQRSSLIAAASVLAKVYRDELMNELGRQDPRFLWSSNKGYGSPAHLSALQIYGPSPSHRQSWSLGVPSGHSGQKFPQD